MTKEQISKVVRGYSSLLKLHGDRAEKADFEGYPTRGEQLRHLIGMCDEIEEKITSCSSLERNWQAEEAKINRWLGFIQGVLWSQGANTLNELREHNAPGCEPE